MNELEYLKKYYKGNIEDAIKRLEKGEPVQYIVGNVNFYGYELDVNKSILPFDSCKNGMDAFATFIDPI